MSESNQPSAAASSVPPAKDPPANSGAEQTMSSTIAAALAGTLKPPVVRSPSSLNRALFSRKLDLTAARVNNPRDIGHFRKSFERSRDLLHIDRITPVVADPDASLAAKGRKCLLMRPGIDANAPDSWNQELRDAVQEEKLGVIPYELTLGYDYWSFYDILESIMPEQLHGDIPSGFNTVGHVAHLNLRDHHLPYKFIIGEVLLEKNPNIRSVINKIESVGTDSAFRTFNYEVLAGVDDMMVEQKECGCVYRFDYSKVYWNSKLETEHRRLVEQYFKPGEVVADVMAGIGPFALPAGKKGVFVWANDMNPESYHYLKENMQSNKVTSFIRPFNKDGRDFIHHAADSVLAAHVSGDCATITKKRKPSPSPTAGQEKGKETPPHPPQRQPTETQIIPVPPTISHFVMNLPASAYTFVHHFRGLYAGQEHVFSKRDGSQQRQMPLVHVHCFAPKIEDETPLLDICARLEDELKFPVRMGSEEEALAITDTDDKSVKAYIHDVRDVAPSKRMFCATFRLPREVAFAPRQ